MGEAQGDPAPPASFSSRGSARMEPLAQQVLLLFYFFFYAYILFIRTPPYSPPPLGPNIPPADSVGTPEAMPRGNFSSRKIALGSFWHFVVAAMNFPEAPKCHFLAGKVNISLRREVQRVGNFRDASESSLFQQENGTWEIPAFRSRGKKIPGSSQVPFSSWKSEDSDAPEEFAVR